MATPADRAGRRQVNVPSGTMEPAFAHASEAEMARILDFYAVRWLYEPDTFPVLWNLAGTVVESFSPDFYLPELDLYLEMTTLKQSLVRKKNRKLRRLRALYPDIRVKLFYARDFRALMLKYGRAGLTASLSGTSGQVPSKRLLAGSDDRLPDLVPSLVAAEVATGPEGTPDPTSATDRPTAPARRKRQAGTRATADALGTPTDHARVPEAPIER